MFSRLRSCVLGIALSIPAVPAAAQLTSIPVGTGSQLADVFIEFKDGAQFHFAVSFDGTTTGLGLLDIIESHTTLTTTRLNFGFGWFIDGISYLGHSNIGYGGGDDWWHYYTKDGPTAPWQVSWVGAGDRIVHHGYSDSWVYGRDGYLPEPMTLALTALGGLWFARRRRR